MNFFDLILILIIGSCTTFFAISFQSALDRRYPKKCNKTIIKDGIEYYAFLDLGNNMYVIENGNKFNNSPWSCYLLVNGEEEKRS